MEVEAESLTLVVLCQEALKLSQFSPEYWKVQHPDWSEIQCNGCKVKARGTPFQLLDWIKRHEAWGHHAVMSEQEARKFLIGDNK